MAHTARFATSKGKLECFGSLIAYLSGRKTTVDAALVGLNSALKHLKYVADLMASKHGEHADRSNFHAAEAASAAAERDRLIAVHSKIADLISA